MLNIARDTTNVKINASCFLQNEMPIYMLCTLIIIITIFIVAVVVWVDQRNFLCSRIIYTVLLAFLNEHTAHLGGKFL